MTNVQRQADIVGQWRLMSFREQAPDGTWNDALGAGARGYISYSAAGHMQAMIGAADRPRLRGEWSSIPDRDRARCLDRMVAYAGRYTLGADRVLHHVEVCWIPNWEGRDLVRLASFPLPHQLLLRTEPSTAGRVRPMQEVLWERAV